MKNLILVVTIILGSGSIHAQPLFLEGVYEVIRFQTDLSKWTGGIITFKSSPSDYIGYMGIHPRRPGDIEVGTTLGSTGSVNITIRDDPKLTISHEGDITIKTLENSIARIPRPLRASQSGQVEAWSFMTGFTGVTVPCNSFVANDRDGEFTKIVNPVGTVQFVQHLASTGELSAPISLPKGVRLTKLKVYYVNQNSATSGFNIRILETPFVPILDDGPTNRSGTLGLPKAGSFISSNGLPLFMDMGLIQHNVSIIISEDSFYSVNIRCSDCSDLFIRSVQLEYNYL